MNPWLLFGLVLGIGALAAGAAAQANAAIPRVSGWGLNFIPTPGVSGLWDFFVTGLNGAGGGAMLQMTPGHQPIYIPAALIQAQPNDVDWTYTFTPKGATTTFTIVVPGALVTAYKNAPKKAYVAQAYQAHAASRAQLGDIQMVDFSNPPPVQQTAITDVAALLTVANGIIKGFPKEGSPAGDYASWGLATGLQVPGIINDVNNAINEPGTSSDNVNSLRDLLGPLGTLVAKAASLALGSVTTPKLCADGSSPGADGTCSDMSTPA